MPSADCDLDLLYEHSLPPKTLSIHHNDTILKTLAIYAVLVIGESM